MFIGHALLFGKRDVGLNRVLWTTESSQFNLIKNDAEKCYGNEHLYCTFWHFRIGIKEEEHFELQVL